MKISKSVIFIVIGISFFLRFYRLETVPPGVYSDEASLGYNAYSIEKTGKDEFGKHYPVMFKAFGEYKNPLYIYLSSIPIKFFGLNNLAIRLTASIFGTLTIIVFYFLVKEISVDDNFFIGKSNSEFLAVITSLVLGVLPWHLSFSRFAYEGTPTLFFIILGLLFFLKGVKQWQYMLFSLACWGISLYGQYGARIFVVGLIFSALLIFWKKLDKKAVVISLIIFLIISLPLILSLGDKESWSRISETSLLADKGLVWEINRARGKFGDPSGFLAKIINNKVTYFTVTFVKNYLSHFTPNFLFIKGDNIEIYNTPATGLLLKILAPFLLFGLISLITNKKSSSLLVLSLLMLAPIPSALTRFAPSANRAFYLSIPLVIIAGVGFVKLYEILKNNKLLKGLVLISVVFIFFFEVLSFLKNYFLVMPVKYEAYWKREYFLLGTYLLKAENNYNFIWSQRGGVEYIYYLYYLNYDPLKYQVSKQIGARDEFGFLKVERFGKFYFDNEPIFDPSGKGLYIFENGLYQQYVNEGKLKENPVKVISLGEKPVFKIFEQRR